MLLDSAHGDTGPAPSRLEKRRRGGQAAAQLARHRLALYFAIAV
ncbi:MAG: hypothetical protein U0359_22260 [Byssovorax sp.]